MLGGIGLTLILTSIIDRRYRDALVWVAVSSDQLEPFLGLYLLIYKAYASNDFLRGYWKNSFAPFPPRSLEDLQVV